MKENDFSGDTIKENKESENIKRRAVGKVILGALIGAVALSKEKSAHGIVSSDTPILSKIDATLVAMTSQIASVAEMIKQELENFNKFMDPFMKTYNNIKTVSDTWNQLIDQINKVMLATEKSRDFLQSLISTDQNIFYIQAKQLSEYITGLVSENSDWAKVRLKRFDWYSQILVKTINDIASQYQDMYAAWDSASKTPNSKRPFIEKCFIYASNQNLKAIYHEVRAFSFNNQLKDIRKKVAKDKAANKLPKDKSEADVVHELSKQMMLQLQINQYAVQVEILNSINALIFAMNPQAFVIPKNMKVPKAKDYMSVFNAASEGDNYPGTNKEN